MTKIKFKVLNKGWTLRMYAKGPYKDKNGTDSVALARYHSRKIDISPKGRDLETIVHELTHAFLYELCLGSMNNLTLEDQGEIFAELMAKRGRELLDLADYLFNQIQLACIDPPVE